ncbi:arginine--tRNA ligase [Calothrix sp. 336/3]|uniref:arginine--tRNA ligase n=1 Tax=Calothrix sp. 336/3 TaxID=1337936 RepID=UPI0004E36B11|nr:arginine--tRNA ligase [Calothrix sp. 336/3]AKG21730.1 arginyl-tRNA synthetase [Calothrix sp. 336/3]
MNSTQEQLRVKLSQALVGAFGEEFATVDPILVAASNPKFGDYQANVALSLSKKLGQQPRAIAQAITDKLDVTDICEQPEIAGPGFINLRLKTDYLQAQLNSIQADPRLGVAVAKHPQREIVDFSSPNIAKEMHVGHLRSTIIGDAIARVLEFLGHDVIRINHVGDWGTQFGMLIAYLREVKPEVLTTADVIDLGDLVELYRQAKKRFDADEVFKETARQEVVKLQSGAADTLQGWKLLCEQSRKEFQKIYDSLNIQISERGESFYNPLLPGIVEDLANSGLLEENQGAQVVFLEGFSNKEGEPLPLIVKKTDGGYNYATTDLAAICYRIQQDAAKRIIYVTDAGQASHFAGVFQVARRAGWIPEDVEVVHVPFGLVLGEDGKRLRTRSSDTVRLQDLLDEAIARTRADLETRFQEEERQETPDFINHVAKVVGISAVKYADLSQNRTNDYKFSFDRMLSLKGNTAPYMLYAYVRIQGISRKGNIDWEKLGTDTQITLQAEAEFTLAKHLLQLDEVISEVEKDLLPHRLCEYLYNLSEKFNKFFESCPVLKSEEPVRTSRLALCSLTARTLKLGLSLLGIEVLERM